MNNSQIVVVEDDMFRMVRTTHARPDLLERLRAAHVLTAAQADVAEGSWALPPEWRSRCRAQIEAYRELSPTWGERQEMRLAARLAWRAAVETLEGALSAVESARADNAAMRDVRDAQQREADRALVRLQRIQRRADARADFARGDELAREIRTLRMASSARHREGVASDMVLQQAEVGAYAAFYDAVDALTRLIAINAAV